MRSPRSRRSKRCLWAPLAAFLGVAALACSTEPAAEIRNVVLISLDTTRPDHLSAYGYERETSPNFDRLAETGVLFDNAFAQWTATGPSHASMLTGLYPPTHRFGLSRKRLRRRFPTFASILSEQGFRTGAFVSGFTLKGRLANGFERGFEVFDGDFKGVRRDGQVTLERALAWLDEGEPDKPFFLFFHLFDAHGPYTAHGQYPRAFHSEEPGPVLDRVPPPQRMPDAEGNFAFHLNEYVDLYDSGLAYQDTILGGLLDAIDLSDTLVMVVADHGESLGEHGGVVNLTHSTGVFDVQSRIPFLISAPGIDPQRIEEIVENVDLLPTTLELLGITPPTRFSPEGSSLVSLLQSERRQVASEIAFTGTWPQRRQARTGQAIFEQENPLQLDPDRTVVAARSARWKLMVFPGRGRDWVALYDLEADPGERTNVANDYPEIRDRLLQRSALWLAQPDEPVEKMELTTDEIEKLRALGYVE